MKSKRIYTILLFLLILGLVLAVLITNTLLTKRRTTKTRASATVNSVSLNSQSVTSVSLNLQSVTSVGNVNSLKNIEVRAVVDNSSKTVSIRGYAANIKIPKPLTISSPFVFDRSFAFSNSEIIEKDTYYEIQFIATNKQIDSFILENNALLGSFSVTSSTPITTSIDFLKGLSYPSVIDSQGEEKLDQNRLQNLSVSFTSHAQ